MTNDRKIDALVGEHIMGHEWRTFGPAGHRVFVLLPPENLESSWAQVCTVAGQEEEATLAADWARWLSRYATDWTAMRSVVEACREKWNADPHDDEAYYWEFEDCHPYGWRARVMWPHHDGTVPLHGVTEMELPAAVAKAALLASGLTEAEIDGGSE